MNKRDAIKFVKEQFAIKNKCSVSEIDSGKNLFHVDNDNFFTMTSFGKNIIISGKEEMVKWCEEKYKDEPAEMIMDGEILYQIEGKLREYDKKLCGQHIKYVHVYDKDITKPRGYQYKLYNRDNIHEFYNDKKFDNALCYDEKVDVMAYGAYQSGKIVALAAADDRNKLIWQIGIDTLYSHRNKGLGVYLVKSLADIISNKNKLSCYTTWGSNIASTNLALRAGFIPVMTYYYVE